MKISHLKTIICLTYIFVFSITNTIAQQTNINGPSGSGRFGTEIVALPNGNIVVTDPYYDLPSGVIDAGAVYLYNGSTGKLISMITGSKENDLIGSYGITVLTNGNYVIVSPGWNGTADYVGAVTFCSKTSGISGTVSEANSLVGSTYGDIVGSHGVTALTNGNYVVNSGSWDGVAANVGAVTFGNGTSGTSGVVSPSNSLVGSTANDYIGINGITTLTNGNYVVSSWSWDGTAVDVGAVTFGNGINGISGTVSETNSLVGSTANDGVGNGGVTALTNGNYVIVSPFWNGLAADVGAVTFGNGTSGTSGVVSHSNSLVGSTEYDLVGNNGVTALTNGNYVVSSGSWDGVAVDVGAVTFGNGTIGISGTVSETNSLVGSTANDNVGVNKATALTNGNYVVTSPNWDGVAVDVGAATFSDGTIGTFGFISSSNSLVGSTEYDLVGINGATALTNGNYVIRSPVWSGAASKVGAVTFGNGMSGINGTVSEINSLVGSTANDRVGNSGITALTNGNYIVRSFDWNEGTDNAGAITFGDGTSGISGIVSSSNSLIESRGIDFSGNSPIVIPLTNGNYVVRSPFWRGVGAVTFGNGTSGINGIVSASNSLVGSTTEDLVLNNKVTALPDGNYIIFSPYFDNGEIVNAGAISYLSGLNGDIPLAGKEFGIIKQNNSKNKMQQSNDLTVNLSNSVLGNSANGGSSMVFSYDQANYQLVVGRPADNTVTLFKRFTTMANVSVAGRVMTAKGIAIPNTLVSITNGNNQTLTARTNNFGYFKFEDIQTGESYVVDANAKGYSFTSQVLNVDDTVSNFTITAN